MCSEKSIGLVSQIGMHLRKTPVGVGTLIVPGKIIDSIKISVKQ